MDNFDFSHAVSSISDTVNKLDTEFTLAHELQINRQIELEETIFEICDFLHNTGEGSNKKSKYNHRVNLIVITIALLTLIATVISLFL